MTDLIKEIEKDIRELMLEKEKLRLEFDNFKSDNEKKHKNFLLELLDIVDSLETKLQVVESGSEDLSEETRNWIKKFQMPHRKLLRLLKDEYVVPIEVNIGEIVNPALHKTIDTVEKAGRTENSIIEFHQKGYLYKGAVLRNTTVTIVKKETKNDLK